MAAENYNTILREDTIDKFSKQLAYKTSKRDKVIKIHTHSCSNYAKNQTVYKKSIALLLRRYWFSSDDVKMKFVYFFMLSKIEVLTFPKKNIFYHFEVHLRSKGSENGYIANIEYLHLNCPNFPKLSCFMVFAHTRTQ